MFAKLLKHEWRANRGLLGLLTLATLGIGLAATVVLRVLVNYGNALASSDSILLNMLLMSMSTTLLFAAFALFLYAVSIQFILLYRFYKHKFTDEGYLTFTLPVSANQIFWSSFANMAIWLVLSVVAIVIVILLVAVFGTAAEGLVNPDALQVLGDIIGDFLSLDWRLLMEEAFGAGAGATVVLYILQMLISPFYALIMPMACVTMGAVVAKKHKILASVGIYYAMNTVTGIAGGMMSIIPSIIFSVGNGGNPTAYMFVTTLFSLLLTTGLTVGGYFLTTYLMRHKLNLP